MWRTFGQKRIRGNNPPQTLLWLHGSWKTSSIYTCSEASGLTCPLCEGWGDSRLGAWGTTWLSLREPAGRASSKMRPVSRQRQPFPHSLASQRQQKMIVSSSKCSSICLQMHTDQARQERTQIMSPCHPQAFYLSYYQAKWDLDIKMFLKNVKVSFLQMCI